MKKKLLFVNNHLNSGGAEYSLTSLLNQIDYSLYSVDLLLFNEEGKFLDRVPKEVNILNSSISENYFRSFKKTFSKLILNGDFKTLLAKIYSFINTSILRKNHEQINAKLMTALTNWKTNYVYDVAIAYKHTFSYFIIDKVKARKKVAYVHSDYKMIGHDPKIDKTYFERLDVLAPISLGCQEIILNCFPEVKTKLVVAPNIMSPSFIKKMAEKEVQFPLDFSSENIKILTIARLDSIKGIDLAIKACALLVENGFNVKWYVIGGGEQEKYIEMINNEGVGNNFILLGEKSNPYPYLKVADIYVQPSRSEGKSIAIEEAKVFCKPIVVTNYPTVSDQINNAETGLVVEINSNGIFKGIKDLITNNELKENISKRLGQEQLGNERDIEVFYKIIE